MVAEPGCNWEPATPSEDPEVFMMVAEDDSPRAARQRTTSGSTDNGFVFVPDSRTTATGMAATATGMATTATGMAEAATGIAHAADRMPEAFLGERAVWPEWSFVTRGYLVAQGMVTPAELHAIENYPYPVQFAHCNQDQLRRSQQMYYKLTLLLRGKMSRLIQKVEPGSGFEAWRLVVQDMLKLDENQSVGLMNQLLRFHLPSPGCVTDVEQCLARLELGVEALRQQHGELAVPDQMLRAVVIKAMPEPLRGHLQLLGLPTYPELKTAILTIRTRGSCGLVWKLRHQPLLYLMHPWRLLRPCGRAARRAKGRVLASRSCLTKWFASTVEVWDIQLLNVRLPRVYACQHPALVRPCLPPLQFQ